MVIPVCVAGVKRGRGNLGTREGVGSVVSRPNTLPFPFQTPATQANGYTCKMFHLKAGFHFTIMYCENNREKNQSKLVIQENNHHINLSEGGVRVCRIAVLGYFWCGVAVISISNYGIAVFRVQAVCGEFKFHVAVVGEKIVVSR